MEVKQFYDEALAHGSYAIASHGQVALVDPGRDPKPYLDFAREHNSDIVAVFETHPHADFTSSHLEFYEQYGATIYINSKVGVSYPHQAMDDGDEVKVGKVTMRALFTPGHSPDHNTYLLLDEAGNPHSVYTGDSLFVGDVGRPDLREGAGNLRSKREDLARQMYHTINDVFKKIEDNVIVYPAHGAGSLCGKNMGPETSSTIGKEREQNWAFQAQHEDEFVRNILENPPFIPQYFPYDVELNREGLAPLEDSLRGIPSVESDEPLEAGFPVVDVRSEGRFKQGHVKGAINIQEGAKFETWLGALIAPNKPFYLVTEDEAQRDRVVRRAAKIGYETHIKGTLVAPEHFQERSQLLDLKHFEGHLEDYTIVDVRNTSEANGNLLFDHAINIPLPELHDRVSEVPTDKPVVVHCAGGYRSAAGFSILEGTLPATKVYDLSEAVKNFQ
jgi:glyoxylase-like metal-dependent hydrolase (beta-lactamase superfamily II)/rhodanese-related sulfurtransferase